VEIEETISHLTSVSNRDPDDEARYLGRSKLMSRAKSNSKASSKVMKSFHPVGYSNGKNIVSKDAPA
jgi:hypothetical protein